MSMIGVTYLNEIVSNENAITTTEILSDLRERIVRLLKQKENRSRDGMDISLVRINLKTLVLEFSGAFNPLILLSDQDRFRDYPDARKAKNGDSYLLVPADRFPIGETGQKQESCFSVKTIPLQKGDKLFLFSDGFSDQFGGPDGKKYRTARFYDFLCSMRQKPMQEQADLLVNEFANWKAIEAQVDDVTVLGIRIV